MAAGIVVRTIAPLLKDKKTDPAVVVLDEKGEYAISLLSGHLGGANRVAQEVADFLKGDAVITTASDVNNLPSIDLWAEENSLVIENWKLLPKISTRLLNKGSLRVYIDGDMQLPDELIKVKDAVSADLLITNKLKFVTGVIPVQTGIQRKAKNSLDSRCESSLRVASTCFRRNDKNVQQLYLRPRNLVVGIGCNSGTSEDEIEDVVRSVLDENNLTFLSIHSLATLDKKGSEPGLISFAGKYNLEMHTFTPGELNSLFSRQPSAVGFSKAAFRATGAMAVAEPAALLAAGAESLLIKKQKRGNVTAAVAVKKRKSAEAGKRERKNFCTYELSNLRASGKLYIVGTGPGGPGHITPRAQEAIRESDVIVGYGTYLDLIEDLIKDKEVVSTGMTQEVDRCRKAVELALSGKTVSVISGGDPGIYAMAGLVFEILSAKEKTYELSLFPASALSVEVIPGISALNACAARLGAPLMHDFASISLSDRLTPWEVIEKRLKAAAKADFVIALYNPKSKGRPEHIHKAQKIILKQRSPETPVGIVKGAMRENEEIIITDLRKMLDHHIDMQTTVIIGNSQTFVWNKKMITPRGYEKKFKI
jgi:cobalt-precorrin 5A hydrolase/precorrin-3B C17-methyltransferase